MQHSLVLINILTIRLMFYTHFNNHQKKQRCCFKACLEICFADKLPVSNKKKKKNYIMTAMINVALILQKVLTENLDVNVIVHYIL